MSEEDEDWFERALRESQENEETAEEAEPEPAGGGAEPEPAGDEAEPEPTGDEAEPEPAGDEAEPEPTGDEAEPEPTGDEAEPEPAGDEAETESEAETPAFEEDFATALENAPGPESFGDEEGAPGPGGAGEFGDEDETFGFGSFGGEAGPAGPGGGESFDEAEFESSIERIDIGIEGLDEMVLGGVPKRSLMAVIGSAGTGKTTFGLQFLQRAMDEDEKGVYITLEESRERILDTAEEKGWPFREYVDEDRLAIVDLDPIEMANSLASIRNDLPRLIDDFGADRLVLDSVSLLEMMYDRPQKRRSEVFNFARALKDAGVTTMLTSEASDDNPYTSRYGIVEYLTDAVFILQYVRPSDFRETRLAVEIQKIRDANHSRETKPYEITNEGISVYRQANIF